jgi:hypothetical protein
MGSSSVILAVTVGIVATLLPNARPFAQSEDVYIAASILPTSRSVRVGTPATVFATLIASGGDARACIIKAPVNFDGAFSFHTTDPVTNAITGTLNTPVDIPNLTARTFVLTLVPAGELRNEILAPSYECANGGGLGPPNVSQLTLSASAEPLPDVIVATATPSHDGILTIPGLNGTEGFSVAAVNVGPSAVLDLSVRQDRGPFIRIGSVELDVCPSDPATGVCLHPPARVPMSTRVQMDTGAVRTFSVFATGRGTTVPDHPFYVRIYVDFRESEGDLAGDTRGGSSVAVRTQPAE